MARRPRKPPAYFEALDVLDRTRRYCRDHGRHGAELSKELTALRARLVALARAAVAMGRDGRAHAQAIEADAGPHPAATSTHDRADRVNDLVRASGLWHTTLPRKRTSP